MDVEQVKRSDSPFGPGLPALYIVALLSGISLGLFNPFISTLMAQNNVGDWLIGLNSTLYFFVITIGTPIVASILRQIGLRYTMMLGFGLMTISAPLFPLVNELSLWFVIRAIMGLAVCMYLISGQTALNYFCSDQNRTMVNGLDDISFSVGFGIGPLLGGIFYKIAPTVAFMVGSLLMFSGILVVYFGLPERNIRFQSLNIGLFSQLTLPLQGSFVYGFSVATLVSLYPPYLLQQDYDVDRIGYVFSLFMLGGLIAVLPVTRWADKFSKHKILLSCAVLTVIVLLGLSFANNASSILILAFVLGAGMTPIFPLSLALIGSKLQVSDLPSGSALFTSVYSAGCTTGPVLSAGIMTIWGGQHIFSLILLFFIFFNFCLLHSLTSKQA